VVKDSVCVEGREIMLDLSGEHMRIALYLTVPVSSPLVQTDGGETWKILTSFMTSADKLCERRETYLVNTNHQIAKGAAYAATPGGVVAVSTAPSDEKKEQPGDGPCIRRQTVSLDEQIVQSAH
jgi:hypothetical protein